jgi:cation diffusion facilitator CzcD-associated flavoprotein CzcO
MHRTSKDQKTSRDLVADIMREQLGSDSFLTKKMIPGFDLGCRRMTPGSGYLQSLKKDNVQVVTESVVNFTKDGVVDETGTEHKVDVVVCATGFDVSFTPHFEVIGREGSNIKDEFLLPLKLTDHSIHWSQRTREPQFHSPNSGMAHEISVSDG